MSKAFTLIELLIVIAILGIVTTVVAVSFTNSQKQARDLQRKSDLKQIRTALELYYNDNGFYPPSACGYDCNAYHYSTEGDDWIPGLAPYMNGKVPHDPWNTGVAPWLDGYTYAYGNVGKNTYPDKFDLTALLESTKDPSRCAVKCWKLYFDNQNWCCGGIYSNQIYEDSPE
jgi:type II secretion system protein G